MPNGEFLAPSPSAKIDLRLAGIRTRYPEVRLSPHSFPSLTHLPPRITAMSYEPCERFVFFISLATHSHTPPGARRTSQRAANLCDDIELSKNIIQIPHLSWFPPLCLDARYLFPARPIIVCIPLYAFCSCYKFLVYSLQLDTSYKLNLLDYSDLLRPCAPVSCALPRQ